MKESWISQNVVIRSFITYIYVYFSFFSVHIYKCIEWQMTRPEMDSVSISTEVTVGSYHMTSQKIVFCTYLVINYLHSTTIYIVIFGFFSLLWKHVFGSMLQSVWLECKIYNSWVYLKYEQIFNVMFGCSLRYFFHWKWGKISG